MQVSIPDVELAEDPGTGASTNAPMCAHELPDTRLAEPDDAMGLDLDLDPAPAVAFTNLATELTAYLSGDATPNTNHNNVAPVPQYSQFDPSSLLNPRSSNSKRPASSGGDPDRGRTDPTIAGQVSLVERLHNVQERTASPAKRVKTEEERKKTAGASTFGGGSALDLQRTNGQAPTQPGPAIDLTMSRWRSHNWYKAY
jgi:hypothetical protein